jgi:DNA ligase (NAD+)
MSSEKIRKLESLITRYRDSYYNGSPEITDEDFDRLEDELRTLHPHSIVLQKVGSAPPEKTKWRKVSHTIPMSSLNKANSLDDLQAWAVGSLGQTVSFGKDLRFSWSEKLDGISIALQYENNALVSAITRGDGSVGEDILANVVLMRGVPRTLESSIQKSKHLTGSFRGEIVLTHDWHRLHFPEYANPRNAASGLSKVEDRDKAKRCGYLSVYIYEAFVNDMDFEDETEKFLFIKSLGFLTPNQGGPLTLDEIQGLYQAYEDFHRSDLQYDIDGLVIRHHRQRHYETAGERSNRPFGAIAYKFKAETQTTVLEDVLWQVGNTGRITPVAVFNPVNLVGATVSRASLYNVSYIRSLGLNKGDEIRVARANDVIPRVESVVRKNTQGVLPIISECPTCLESVREEGEYLVCPNDICPSRVSGNIKAWVSTLNLLEWGDTLIDILVDVGKVASVPDLYRLSTGDIAELTNSGGAVVGEKTAQKMLDTLHGQKQVTLDVFVGGLNIPLCRDKTVRTLMSSGFQTLDSLQNASVQKIATVHGLGDQKAQALVSGLKERSRLISDLLHYVEIVPPKGALVGKSFCITGSLSKPRKVIEKLIKDHGGEVKNAVTSSLTYLLTNETDSESSKTKKARALGTQVITEDEFLQMLD